MTFMMDGKKHEEETDCRGKVTGCTDEDGEYQCCEECAVERCEVRGSWF